jgi:Mce-associated membrane protein
MAVDDDERSAMRPDPTRATVTRVPSLSPRGVLVAAVVLLVAAALVAFTQGRGYLADRDREQAGADAMAAGRQLAINFVTMDYRQFDDYGKRVLQGAGGDFADQYSKSLADLKKVVVENKTVSSVKRAEAALVSGDADSARVIVGVVAPTSNSATPQPVAKTYRLRLDLQRSGSSWKVVSLDFVG